MHRIGKGGAKYGRVAGGIFNEKRLAKNVIPGHIDNLIIKLMKSFSKLLFLAGFTLMVSACQPVSVTPNILSPTPIPATLQPSATLSPIPPTRTVTPTITPTAPPTVVPTPAEPLSIEYLRQQSYNSEIKMEMFFEANDDYETYIVSYLSEGLKIYALLTIPLGEQPVSGWPVIVLNHGYITAYQYSTTEDYEKYVDAFASAGYIVLKPDYRGHGDSEGEAVGGYSTPDYTIDILNALGAIKAFPQADENRIGIWGHSMGGFLTLRAMVIDPDIKAGVIWGGVVGSYADMCTHWFKCDDPFSGKNFADQSGVMLTEGPPSENPAFWAAASANSYLSHISGPLQLHHSRYDNVVPYKFSQFLYDELIAIGADVELHQYQSTDHNITGDIFFGEAVERSLRFFDLQVKLGGK